jgi:cytochrome c553
VYNPRPFAAKRSGFSSVQEIKSRVLRLPSSALAILACSLLSAGAAAQTEQGSVEAGQQKAAECTACHGPNGNSPTAEIGPSLAGQHASYIVRQLRAFKEETRVSEKSPLMKPFADKLSEQDMRDVAAYFAAQTLTPKGADPALVGLGEEIYRGGIPERGIAACIACHGPRGSGNPLAAYPRISGQHADYVARTLSEYASGMRRSDADLNQMMRNVAELLLDDEIRALASYVQGLQ